MIGSRLRSALSRAVGWLADRRVPTPLRPLVFHGYGWITGARPAEAELEPRAYPSLGAFFVRRLKPGLRTFPSLPKLLPSPCDGTFQALDRIRSGHALQAKGQPYDVAELLAGLGDDLELEGGRAWTIYLSPRDYHRVHVPRSAELSRVAWVAGDRFSVAPTVVASRARVFVRNERAVLRLESAEGPYFLVLVGALNVGRIRVLGVAPGESPEARRRFERGEEIARFEMGSTVVLVFPGGPSCPRETPNVVLGKPVQLGEPIGMLP